MTHLVIKCTWGLDAPERANQALNVATIALASGVDVSFWLAGEGSWLAVPGKAEELVLEHANPAAELIRTVAADGTLTVCSQCAARRDLGQADLLDGARIAGSATFVEESLHPDAKVLVY